MSAVGLTVVPYGSETGRHMVLLASTVHELVQRRRRQVFVEIARITSTVVMTAMILLGRCQHFVTSPGRNGDMGRPGHVVAVVVILFCGGIVVGSGISAVGFVVAVLAWNGLGSSQGSRDGLSPTAAFGGFLQSIRAVVPQGMNVALSPTSRHGLAVLLFLITRLLCKRRYDIISKR